MTKRTTRVRCRKRPCRVKMQVLALELARVPMLMWVLAKAKLGPVLAQMLAQVSGPVKPVQIPV